MLVDSYDLRENRANSNFDERHLVNFNYIYQVPNIARWFRDAVIEPTPNCCSPFMNQLFGGWEYFRRHPLSIGDALHRDQQCGKYRHLPHG